MGFVVERSLRFVADDLPGVGDGLEARRVAAPVGVGAWRGGGRPPSPRLVLLLDLCRASRRGPRRSAAAALFARGGGRGGVRAASARWWLRCCCLRAVAIPLCMRSVIIYRNLSISLFLTNNEPTAPGGLFACLASVLHAASLRERGLQGFLQLAGGVIRSKISTRAQHSWLATRHSAAQPQHTAPEHAAPPPAAQQPSPATHGPAPLYRPVGGFWIFLLVAWGLNATAISMGIKTLLSRPASANTDAHGVFTSTDELPTTGHRGARKAAVG